MIKKPPINKFGGWSIDESEWDWIAEILLKYNIKSVVEFGMGTSTILFKQLVEELVCYESDDRHAEKLRTVHRPHIRYISHAAIPLLQEEEGGLRRFDLAFVDAPYAHKSKKKYTRANTMWAARAYSDMVLVHDSKRIGESNSIKVLFSGWTRIDCLSSSRGLTLLINEKGLEYDLSDPISQIPDEVRTDDFPYISQIRPIGYFPTKGWDRPREMAFATVVRGKTFKDLFEVFLKSLVKHNPKIGYPFHVFTYQYLSEETRDKLKEIYSNLVFQNVDLHKYAKHDKKDPKFWALETFNLRYDKVIFLDVDLLCLRPIDELLSIEADVAMAREIRRPCFNSGVFIVGKKYLNEETYDDLINMELIEGRFGKDQQLYNRYFEGKITHLDRRFNTLITEAPPPGELGNIMFLHYIHKPLADVGRPKVRQDLLAIWEEYNES